MNILIIEDELPAAKRLRRLCGDLVPGAQILEVLDSVEDSVAYLKQAGQPDLILMDIHLADGLSLSIFDQVEVTAPVIFTTAYDQYAVQAFRLNGLDYLLKPIDPGQFEEAVQRLSQRKGLDQDLLQGLLRSLEAPANYRERFLVKSGDQFRYVQVSQLAWIRSDGGYLELHTKTGSSHLVDQGLEQTMSGLDPRRFFQVNRKFIVEVAAIGQIHAWFNSRLKLDLLPAAPEEVIVSRDRVKAFKAWLDQ